MSAEEAATYLAVPLPTYQTWEAGAVVPLAVTQEGATARLKAVPTPKSAKLTPHKLKAPLVEPVADFRERLKRELARLKVLGWTPVQIAGLFGVKPVTVSRWSTPQRRLTSRPLAGAGEKKLTKKRLVKPREISRATRRGVLDLLESVSRAPNKFVPPAEVDFAKTLSDELARLKGLRLADRNDVANQAGVDGSTIYLWASGRKHPALATQLGLVSLLREIK